MPFARKEFVLLLLVFLDAYPMALKVVCDGLNETVSEASIGVFRIIGVESEALVAEALDAADSFYRAGRAAPKRGAGFGLDHLGVESRVHLG